MQTLWILLVVAVASLPSAALPDAPAKKSESSAA